MIPVKRTVLTLLFLCLTTLACSAEEQVDVTKIRGPKIRELYQVITRDPDSQILALEKGTVDVLGDITRPTDVERLSTREDLTLSLARAFHILEMGFNLRRAPWERPELRRAAAMVIDRNRIVRDLFAGFATPLTTLIPPISPYYESDVSIYPYDPAAAKQLLKKAGWSWSDDGILTPPGESEPLEKMQFLSPTAQVAPTTAELSERIATAFRELGIPAYVEPLDFSVMIKRLNDHDFDLFVLAWNLTRDPDSLFAFFHSSMDVQDGYNIQGLHDPKLDKVLERLRYAPDEPAARTAASEAQKMLAEIVPVVPIYSRFSIAAVRKGWDGLITSDVSTADNGWSMLNMTPSDGKMRPLYWTLSDEPRSLNPLAGSSAYDWQVLGLLYDAPLTVSPYDLSDLPSLAESWDVGTVEAGVKPVTRLTFRFRPDLTWHDGKPLTAEDFRHTLLFLKENEVPRFFDSVRDIASIEVPDPLTAVVTMDNVSYWHLHNIGGMMVLPRHVLEKVEDWRSWQPSRNALEGHPGLTELVGSGPFVFREYRPGEFVRFTRFDDYWMLRR